MEILETDNLQQCTEGKWMTDKRSPWSENKQNIFMINGDYY